MSFCVNCGSEYDAKSGNNFCAHCGSDFRENKPQNQDVLEKTSAINPTPTSQTVKKPIVGIIVALVLGLVGLIWTCAVLFHTLYGTPSSTQIAFQQSFPSLPIITCIGLAFALIGNVVLIIGALMAHLNHPSGAKVVRIASYSVIGLTFLGDVVTFFAVMGADAWPTLDAPTKGALIGSLVGGTIGAIFQCVLILFLFSKTKSIPNTRISIRARWQKFKSSHPSKLKYIYGLIGLVLLIILILYYNRSTPEEMNANGDSYLFGKTSENIAKDYPTAMRWYLKSAKNGYTLASGNIGYMYSQGMGVERDYCKALKYYKISADAGDAHSCYNVGILYYNGTGVDRNISEAAQWYRKAADLGDVDAQKLLANMYCNGFGVETNYEEAIRLDLKAAEFESGNLALSVEARVDIKTLDRVCYMFCQGYGNDEDYQKEISLLKEAIFKYKNSGAITLMGGMYYKGYGVKRDAVESSKYYKQASEAGQAKAQYFLAQMYTSGIGVDKDYAQALIWLKKSAEGGISDSQYLLAYDYIYGIGVEKDLIEAEKWCRKAAAQGNEKAKELLKELVEK